MLTGLLERADLVGQQAPADRDRVADLLRLGSIVLVVLGHWLVATVLTRDGELVTGQLLQVVPETRWLTYLFQVMPVFFVVGGYVNAGSWQRAAAAGEPWAVWVRRRSRRLLGPFVPLLVLWSVLVLLLGAADLTDGLVATAADTALLPVWFLAVYLITVGLVPVTLWLHRRAGVTVLVVVTVLVAVVDVLHRAEVPVVGFVNYLLVWGGLHQIGYLWADGRPAAGPARTLSAAAAGIAVLAVLVGVLGYPLSMVAVQGAADQNTDPPTLALWVFGLVQTASLLAARGPLRRWLDDPRRYGLVVLGGSVVLTVFLWHMTALVAAGALVHPTGLWPAFGTVDGLWWALRPVWLLLCGAVLAGFVAVFGRFERLRDPVPREGRLLASVSLAATVAGIALVMTVGIADPDRALDLPVGALGLLLAGLGGLGVLRPAASRSTSHADGA
jgi:fucose 4-O-acetylase-like acetyltransferase